MSADRFTDLLADVLDSEVAADDWEAVPAIAFVFGDRTHLDAVGVWVPPYVWDDEAGDPRRVLLILASMSAATGAAPLLRVPDYPKLLGVAFWANAWAAPFPDDGDPRSPAERPDRRETKVALFAHIDGRQWRAIQRDRGAAKQIVASSRNPNASDGGPLLDALKLVAEAAHLVKFER